MACYCFRLEFLLDGIIVKIPLFNIALNVTERITLSLKIYTRLKPKISIRPKILCISSHYPFGITIFGLARITWTRYDKQSITRHNCTSSTCESESCNCQSLMSGVSCVTSVGGWDLSWDVGGEDIIDIDKAKSVWQNIATKHDTG